MRKWNIRKKIILSTLACVLCVTIFGNLILYSYMRDILANHRNEINRLYLSTLSSQFESHMDNSMELVLQCAGDARIMETLARDSYNRTHLTAQKLMDSFLDVFPDKQYVRKLMAFSDNGMIIQAESQYELGYPEDGLRLLHSFAPEALENLKDSSPYIFFSMHPLLPFHLDCPVVGMLCPAFRTSASNANYVYLELDLNFFQQTLEPYLDDNILFLTAEGVGSLTSLPQLLNPDTIMEDMEAQQIIREGRRYQFLRQFLPVQELSLNLCYSAGLPDTSVLHLLFPFSMVFLTVLLLSLILAFITSRYISRPVQVLEDRLKRISENDFSFDPAIEASSDELGTMGRTINEMTLSIKHLLGDIEQMYEKRKNIELSLLQSQVNPHFLYNTIDSIRWMAVIQKNPGIAEMAQRLVSLLRNLAKGTQDRIPLRQELSLLEDYIGIQNIRYMETFSFVNRIPPELMDLRILKFTLQPLVENAIFHGIEPTGRFGTITLTGRREGQDLLLCVEDDGMGIPEEKLETLFTDSHSGCRTSLNGIGIANLHQRLQLLYGRQYGLSVRSKVNQFTRVTVRIPAEYEDSQTERN